ncbi:hypothetical protein GCM10009118_05650 [Wandonia haliotis]|uniref:Uncharacterized protein n=1 Tax=Wandonia haliotis TaxID=574963 RepID=A0ABN1MMI9_9FLAO
MKLFGFIFLVFVGGLVSCHEQQPEQTAEPKREKKKFEMHESSEMASLMRQMHHINMQLKERISAGEDLGEFPESFERILEAAMTEGHVKDEFFITHAESFLESQRAIYANPEQAEDLYNKAVASCIECHQVKCTGPIPKIQQLILE